MKRIFVFTIISFLFIFSFSGCSSATDNDDIGKEEKTDKFSVVTTIFPIYDWSREIAGDNSDNMGISFLMDDGVDMHSNQITAEDIMKISTCDLFIYVGGESDNWIDEALSEAQNKDMLVLNLMEVLGDKAKEETLVEGMQEEHNDEEKPEMDEHIWLSLKNAEIICDAITEKFAELDNANSDMYYENLNTYKAKIQEMDAQYQETVDNAPIKTLLFADRFPFRYLVDDYGISYYAAYPGCSAESEVSFDTITFLSSKIDELGLTSVMTLEGSNHQLAETVINNTTEKNQKILTMNSMQSIDKNDISNSVTYISLMQDNLSAIKEALNLEV